MEFINATPIEDVWTVLDLLTKSWGDGTVRRLHVAHPRDRVRRPTHIEIMRSSGSRDEYDSSDFYRVADNVVDALRAKGWVSGQKHWGYTDDKELHANDGGKTAFFALLETVATKGEREMRAAHWFREVRPNPWALPAAPSSDPSPGTGSCGATGHGKSRATWQTEDCP